MFNRSTIVRIGVLFSICLPAAQAAGVDNTFLPASGSWHTASNWSWGHVPNATERVVIPSGTTCILVGAGGVADGLSLFGQLQVVNCSLTLDGSSSAQHALSGYLLLVSSLASVRFIDRNHTLTGLPGTIEGLFEGARFEDDGQDRTLLIASSTSIFGWLDVEVKVANAATVDAEGPVTFKRAVTNNGTIRAGDSLHFDGPLTSNGVIQSDGELSVSGSLVNNGLMLIDDCGRFNGSVSNSGSISVQVAGACDFNGSTVNNGLMQVAGSTTFNRSIAGTGLFSVVGGVMTFSAGSSATSMNGDFSVTDGGEVRVNANVRTKGFLKIFSGSGSKFRIAEGKSISFGV